MGKLLLVKVDQKRLQGCYSGDDLIVLNKKQAANLRALPDGTEKVITLNITGEHAKSLKLLLGKTTIFCATNYNQVINQVNTFFNERKPNPTLDTPPPSSAGKNQRKLRASPIRDFVEKHINDPELQALGSVKLSEKLAEMGSREGLSDKPPSYYLHIIKIRKSTTPSAPVDDSGEESETDVILENLAGILTTALAQLKQVGKKAKAINAGKEMLKAANQNLQDKLRAMEAENKGLRNENALFQEKLDGIAEYLKSR